MVRKSRSLVFCKKHCSEKLCKIDRNGLPVTLKLNTLQTNFSAVFRFVVLITCKRKLYLLKYVHEAEDSADAAVQMFFIQDPQLY